MLFFNNFIIGLNFPHQLIRPPTTSVNALPTFMPIVSIAVSPNKGKNSRRQKCL